jgi:hypothetical protein
MKIFGRKEIAGAGACSLPAANASEATMNTSRQSRSGTMTGEGVTLRLAPKPGGAARPAPDERRPAPFPGGRNLPVFRPRREIYILHHHFGRVVEIGMGGIRFTYLVRSGMAEPAPAAGTLFTAEETLDGIRFEVVAEGVLAPDHAGRLLMERHLGFGELTGEQLERLERFILDNALIPRWS